MRLESLTVPGRALASATHVRAYERAAEAVVLAEVACAEHGCPLNERQRISILSSTLQCFDGLSAELEDGEEVVAFLLDLRPGERVVNGERLYSAAFLNDWPVA
jgi:hypothetical protein